MKSKRRAASRCNELNIIIYVFQPATTATVQVIYKR